MFNELEILQKIKTLFEQLFKSRKNKTGAYSKEEQGLVQAMEELADQSSVATNLLNTFADLKRNLTRLPDQKRSCLV